MTSRKERHLQRLLDRMAEGPLSAAELQQVEKLVMQSPANLQTYLDWTNLHGSLFWDAAHDELTVPEPSAVLKSDPETICIGSPAQDRKSARLTRSAGAAVLVAILLISMLLSWPNESRMPSVNSASNSAGTKARRMDSDASIEPGGQQRQFRALELEHAPKEPAIDAESSAVEIASTDPVHDQAAVTPGDVPKGINQYLHQSWTENGMVPSARATDEEWLRRVYLDLAGHVPPHEKLISFLRDEHPQKRNRLIDELLDSEHYVTNLTTIWSNLLIGRTDRAGVDRTSLRRYLLENFTSNQPWSKIVHDLVAAEGRVDENGAANFLVAHLNDQAVPATTVTSRLFLGEQIQCAQCHDHPFNDQRQDSFWQLNGFFAQSDVVIHRKRTPGSNDQQMIGELTRTNIGGPTFFETRNALMKSAFPRFAETTLPDDASINRRAELARLMTTGRQPRLARAFVNRVWSRLFGHGFTRSVTDMGPHVEVSHPELLAFLADAFIASGYDMRQLHRWICQSDAYQLSSRFSNGNERDDPDRTARLPLFSRMYLKPMTAEQVFDSLVVVTGHFPTGVADRFESRDAWIRQFVLSYATEENDESLLLDGSITQALVMMNSRLIEDIIKVGPESVLRRILQERSSDSRRIEQICLATLSRYPTTEEERQFRSHLQTSRRSDRKSGAERGCEDILWAYLNSSEFLYVH